MSKAYERGKEGLFGPIHLYEGDFSLCGRVPRCKLKPWDFLAEPTCSFCREKASTSPVDT